MIIREGEAADVEPAHRLLEACGLPLGGFPEDLEAIFVATSANGLRGVAGLEVHGTYGLLRSLAVAPEARGQGLAHGLCTKVEDRAAELGLQLFLLTESAERFFKHRGYEVVDRKDAPDGITSSREFSDLCPSSALLMKFTR
jgi:amino-acid N-acetyltransferase